MLQGFGIVPARECAGTIEVPEADFMGQVSPSCFLFVCVLLIAHFQDSGLPLDILPKNIRSVLV